MGTCAFKQNVYVHWKKLCIGSVLGDGVGASANLSNNLLVFKEVEISPISDQNQLLKRYPESQV